MGHHKPQKGVTFTVGGDAGFLGAQREAELVEDLRDLSLGLLSLGGGLAQDHKVIGVAHEAVAEFVELPVQMVQDDVGVGDLSRDCFPDERVGKVIKTANNVGIEHNSIACIVVLDGQLQGLMAVASWAKAEGRWVEQRLEDRVQQAAQDLLSNPISNRGDTERAQFSSAFIEVLAT